MSWRALGVLILGAAMSALGGCESPKSALEPHELAVAAQQVTSLATEGEWLAQQLSAGSIPEGMAWVHQKALGDDAVKVMEDLSRPVPESLRAQHETLARLIADLQSKVTRIAGAAARPEELQSLQGELHLIATQASPLGAKA